MTDSVNLLSGEQALMNSVLLGAVVDLRWVLSDLALEWASALQGNMGPVF